MVALISLFVCRFSYWWKHLNSTEICLYPHLLHAAKILMMLATKPSSGCYLMICFIWFASEKCFWRSVQVQVYNPNFTMMKALFWVCFLQRYGPVISAIPQQLSRFNFNAINNWFWWKQTKDNVQGVNCNHKYSHISNGLVKMCLSHLKSLETIIQIYKVSDSVEREMTLWRVV